MLRKRFPAFDMPKPRPCHGQVAVEAGDLALATLKSQRLVQAHRVGWKQGQLDLRHDQGVATDGASRQRKTAQLVSSPSANPRLRIRSCARGRTICCRPKEQWALDFCHQQLIIHAMRFKTIILLFVIGLGAFSSPSSTFYFNQSEPGTDVKIFATNIISVSDRLQQSVTFSEDGKEYYFGITGSRDWNYETILCTRVLTNGQTVTETPSFATKFHFRKNKFIGEPSLAPDGRQLFFVADFPPDIWVATRMENNEWSEAKKLPAPINSDTAEWSPFVSARGTLYFCSTRNRSAYDGRIYNCEKENGVYKEPELLKGEINDDEVGDPAVSPDEKCVVFASPKKGGCGGNDLYISHRQKDGTWSKGFNLGPKVNTAGEELGPRISHDGKYLFFYRRDKWQDATCSDIYWTEIKQFMSLK